jgi:Tfp pilus assembly major pilin PilA
MRINKTNRGFTLAELAASLGVFALAATILTPAFAGVTATSETMTTVSEENVANVSPFTPPVDSILIDVKDTAGNLVKQAVVNDPTATTTTVTGLDANKDYTFEVVKKNQAGQSPAAVAQVVYTKVGERVEPRTRIIQVPDTNRPVYRNGKAIYKNGRQLYRNGAPIWVDDTTKPIREDDKSKPTAWAKKVVGYEQKGINVGRHRVTVSQQKVRNVTKTRQVRIAPFERQVRVAPFTRSVRVAPFERVTHTPASTYTYSCTKSRNESYRCGTTTYTYTGTCTGTRTNYCTTPRSCRTVCSGSGRNRRCSQSCSGGTRYACGTSTYTYSCTKTGSEPRFCTRSVSYQSTCTGTTPARTTSTPVYNYREEAVFNYRTEAVFNYRTESYTVQETYTDTSSWEAEGGCSGSVVVATGTHYSCVNLQGPYIKFVDDTSRPIYADDKSKPIAWAKKVVGYQKKQNGFQQIPNGFEQVLVGYEQVLVGYKLKDAVDNYTVTLDVKKGITAAQSVKASPGQLLLDASSVKTVNRAWKEATIAASGSNKAVGSKVKFTTGQLVTLNGKQYIAVASAATR